MGSGGIKTTDLRGQTTYCWSELGGMGADGPQKVAVATHGGVCEGPGVSNANVMHDSTEKPPRHLRNLVHTSVIGGLKLSRVGRFQVVAQEAGVDAVL